MKHWHVIKTKPHKEDSVATLLKNGDFEVFYPRIIKILRQKPVVGPLFPTYLFLFTDFDFKKNFHTIKYTRGISKILCANNRPVPISKEIITTIKQRMDDRGIITNPANLKTGDQIRVRRGILKDLVGIIEKKTSDEERVVVLLKLLNHRMKATLHWSDVERL